MDSTQEPEVPAIEDEALEDPDGHAGDEVEPEHDLDVSSFTYEDEECDDDEEERGEA